MHDNNGTPVKVGDKVLLIGTLKEATENEDYCNVTFEAEHPMYPGESRTTVILNARQIVLLGRPPAASE